MRIIPKIAIKTPTVLILEMGKKDYDKSYFYKNITRFLIYNNVFLLKILEVTFLHFIS